MASKYGSFSAVSRLIISIGCLFVIAGIVVIVLVHQQIRKQTLVEASEKSRMILDRNLAIHNYFTHQLKPKLFELHNSLQAECDFEPTWMSSGFAIREIEKYFKKLSPDEYYYKQCAVNARNPENEADVFESAFIKELNKEPKLIQQSQVRMIEGHPYFVTLRRGEPMSKVCLRCHGAPEDAPEGLVRNYGRERGFRRRIGDYPSAISIRVPVSAAYEEATSFSFKLSLLLLMVLGTLFVIHLWLSRRLVFSPLARIHEKAVQIARHEKHLGEKIPLPAGKELNELTDAFNTMSVRLRKSIDQLEERIKEREALIRELESKNAELERFTYTASHDLKSPLITIKGFLGVLEKDLAKGDHEGVRADMTRISDATQKMRVLLDELLELSRIGRIISAPAKVDFGKLAQEAADSVAGRLSEGGVRIQIAPDLPTIYGDVRRLREVVENLIDNAVKFRGNQPDPVIEIGARQDDQETVFFVRDSGIGVDPRFHEKVFGLFDKLDPKTEGTGVGLAIVKRIVEVHGGRIWVESEGEGRGTAFCFTLPGDMAGEKGG